jgi:hypothetical protein
MFYISTREEEGEKGKCGASGAVTTRGAERATQVVK